MFGAIAQSFTWLDLSWVVLGLSLIANTRLAISARRKDHARSQRLVYAVLFASVLFLIVTLWSQSSAPYFIAQFLGIFFLIGFALFTTRLAGQAAKRAWEETDNLWQDKLESELADRRSVERELAHLASFAEMAPNPVLETDNEGKIGYVNPAAQQIFPDLKARGREHPLFSGLDAVLEVLHRENRSLLHRPIHLGDRVFDQQISLLEDGPGIRIYMSDITELKRADQMKSDFVNIVSHELRSPLTAIQATIRLVEAGFHGEINAEQKNSLSIALTNIERLGRLINEFLDISKVEAGCFPFHPQPVDMVALIGDLAKSFQPLVQQRGLELRTRVEAERIPMFVDRDQITQILTNLVQNALKFTLQGYVEIGLQMETDRLLCRVSDTGPGIAPEFLPKVFTKFQQLGHVAASAEKGTGLGLSLCKGLVELHGGTIWVESRLGEGSHFKFTLPRISAEEFFHRKAEDLFGRAVAMVKSLAFVSLRPRDAEGVRHRLGDGPYDSLLDRLEGMIQGFLRKDIDTVIKAHGAIYLALPALSLVEIDNVTRRILENLGQLGSGDDVPAAGEWSLRKSIYPQDGNVLQQLLAKLNDN